MFLVAHTITKLLKDYMFNICCMNCKYYYVNDYKDDSSYCSIDKQEIHPDISHIIKCNAYSYWFGVID